MQTASLRAWTRVTDVIYYDYNHIYQTPLLGQDYDTRSFFKLSLTGLDSEFSFS